MGFSLVLLLGLGIIVCAAVVVAMKQDIDSLFTSQALSGFQQGSMDPTDYSLDELYNGHRTLFKYTVTPLEPIYHLTSTHHNLDSAQNCSENTVTLTMKHSGISLMAIENS